MHRISNMTCRIIAERSEFAHRGNACGGVKPWLYLHEEAVADSERKPFIVNAFSLAMFSQTAGSSTASMAPPFCLSKTIPSIFPYFVADTLALYSNVNKSINNHTI